MLDIFKNVCLNANIMDSAVSRYFSNANSQNSFSDATMIQRCFSTCGICNGKLNLV